MADLSNWISNITNQESGTNNAELNALKSDYNSSISGLNGTYNNSLSQAKQTLNQVPSNYNTLRNTADITKNQATNMLPANLANSGAATDSGANYVASTNIGNAYQNTMGDIGKQQSAAQQTAQNNINNLGTTHQSDLGTLANTYNTNYANALSTNAKNILDTALSGYNSEASREEQAQEAANSLAASEQKAANTAATKQSTLPSTVLKNIASDYITTNTKAGTKTINDPDTLIAYIANSGLSAAQQNALVDQIPYKTSTGQTLGDYMQFGTYDKFNPNTTVVSPSTSKAKTTDAFGVPLGITRTTY